MLLPLTTTLFTTISVNSAQALLPFFNSNGSINSITPPAPALNTFDLAINQVCGNPGKTVSRSEFQSLLNNNPTVLARIKNYLGGYVYSPSETPQQFLNNLTDIWFNVSGFTHIFCGQPVAGRAVGGMHFAGRYVDLQNRGLAGRLPNNTGNELVTPGVQYTLGVQVSVNGGTSQSPVKGYTYILNAEEILEQATLTYLYNENSGSTNYACNADVTDDELSPSLSPLTAVFVTRNSGITTFYVVDPRSIPNNPSCVQFQ